MKRKYLANYRTLDDAVSDLKSKTDIESGLILLNGKRYKKADLKIRQNKRLFRWDVFTMIETTIVD